MSRPSSSRWLLVPALVLALPLLCACGKGEEGGKGGAKKEGAAPAASGPVPAAVEVVVADVTQQDVAPTLEFVGQTVGFEDVEIRARVEGYLLSQDYTEGTLVKKGDPLYTIDPKEFEAAVERAKGELASAEGMLERTTKNAERYKPLLEAGAVSQKEYDDAVASQKSAQGQVDSAKAALDQAQLNLGYTKIASPVAGLVGQTQVNVGNLVGRGQNTLLTTVSVIDPIRVRIALSEPDFLKLARKRAQDMKEGEAPPKREFHLTLADGKPYPLTGTFLTLDRAVDQSTGTIRFDVKFDNPDGLLRPGAFAKLAVQGDSVQGALLVPQRSLTELQGTKYVAVVTPEMRVEMRKVKVGTKVGSDQVIEEGLKPGERVVLEGIQKVRDGTMVTVRAPASAPSGPEGAAPPSEEGAPAPGAGK